jgi:hypothetical protein
MDYNPRLVEPKVKHVLNNYLYKLKLDHEMKRNLIFNVSCLFILFVIILVTLYIKYKGRQNIEEIKKKEQKKKEYILTRLRKYQNMIEQPLTNIPLI